MPHLTPRVRALSVLAALGTLGAAGTAVAQQETVGVRAAGSTAYTPNSAVMWSLPVMCVDGSGAERDCLLGASGQLKVTAATKARYKLPSTVVAKGDLIACGKVDCVRMASTATTRERLKRVSSLPVTITLRVTNPLRQTLTKKTTLRKARGGRVVLQTSNLGG